MTAATTALMESDATGRRNPYAKVGVAINGDVTDAAEALKLAGLDYTVQLDPMTTTVLLDNGVQTLDVKRQFAVNAINPERTQAQQIATVGSVYFPRQNKDTAVALQHIVDAMHGRFIAGGHTHNKTRTFIQMELPENARKIGGRDALKYTLVALNRHDGHGKFKIVVAPQRLACMNQLPGLNRSELSVGFSHTKGSGEQVNMADLRKALKLSVTAIENYTGLFEQLAAEPMTVAEFDKFAERVFPMAKGKDGLDLVDIIHARRAEVRALFTSSPTMETIRNTRWAAYNAVTEWDQWMKARRSDVRIVTGGSDLVASRALRILV